MDDDWLIFALPFIGVWMLLMVLIAANSTEDSPKHKNTEDSIACVKAGGEWNVEKELCIRSPY